MSFDGIFLGKLKNELNILKTGRISKISELTDTNFLLTVRANRLNYNLFMGFSSDTARIHLTNREYNHSQSSKAFTLFLKKQIEGFFIKDINQYETDRILIFDLEGYNEMKDRTKRYLICEVMGRYSNLILTDESYLILEALHHDGVGEFNRIIMPNAPYKFPETNKINPYSLSLEELNAYIIKNNLDSPKKMLNAFLGVSYTFLNEVFKTDSLATNFYTLLHDKYLPSTFINQNNKEDFYFYSAKPTKEYPSISEMLDELFYEADKQNQIRKETNDLTKFITREINKNEKKILKLEAERNLALNSEEYKLYGELLLSAPNLKAKEKNINVYNYYANQEINILLDEKLTILENSQKYYKKYQKLKKSIAYIDEQLSISREEIAYFKLLAVQVETSNLNDVLEIYDELIKNKYLPAKKATKKKKKPNLTTYELANGTLIYVGKNNIQNEYLTHHLAKAQDLWFHVKDGSGSHVVIAKASDYTEAEIRTAANLAAYFSYAQKSGSVAVDYTKIRYIKKIPGRRACFVTYTNQSTIYIDPDIKEINELQVKK